MITEDYCSNEVAELLREKGFKEPVTELNRLLFEEGKKPLLKITHQKAMKWLREMHNICITIYPYKGKGYEAVLYNVRDDVEIILQSFDIFGSHIFEDSYEQTCESAIKYCLERLI